MKHTHLHEWKAAANEAGFTIKQTQGFEQFEALDGDVVMGRWNAEHGHLEEKPVEEAPPEPLGDIQP